MRAARGVKKQVLGGVLIATSAITTLLSQLIGFELDILYPIIGAAGASLLVIGSLQRKTGSKVFQEKKQKRLSER